MSDEQNVRRVLRWEVPVDDQWHQVGGGKVLHVAVRDGMVGRVEIWTLEPNYNGQSLPARTVRVYGTGHPIADADTEHIGTAVVPGARLVWHVFGAPS